jgi:hypothetical protein
LDVHPFRPPLVPSGYYFAGVIMPMDVFYMSICELGEGIFMRVYIAGPMRGIKFCNFPSFDDARDMLLKQGHAVRSPADMDRDNGFDAMALPVDYDWNKIPMTKSELEDCLRRDFEAVVWCDQIYMLDGWENSIGAKAELGFAQMMGKKVEYQSQPRGSGSSQINNPKDAIGARKAKFSTIPAGVLFEVGTAMLEGAVKYGRHNFRVMGLRASVYYDASMGHIADWWEGQDIDPDSGLHHVTKAISTLVVLRDAMLQDKMTDDRPPKSKVFKRDFNADAARIIDLHKDKNPKHWTIKDDLTGFSDGTTE